ncbi:MAG: squalene synthase HpnC [Betaproteobacteria bacterium]|nr:squalene synthase HpnC [Betaproteobacteria bacterium]NDF64935.1 squalene synthase HpnC [Betaproteobacteria bacterium]
MDHYENFPVASWLCPPALRAPILALYGFARTADDIADEGNATAAERLALLQLYRQDLHESWRNPQHRSAQWPEVFAALARQHQTWAFPLGLLEDLLDAFEQDVTYTRDHHVYADRTELLDYCRRSANPIGRLILHLAQVQDAESLAMSDAICSALQLINFWQDLSVDVPRGRLYLPLGANLTDELAYARALMEQGAPLVRRLSGRLGWELRLVVQGGLRILDKAEREDTRRIRPTVHAGDTALMLWRALRM